MISSARLRPGYFTLFSMAACGWLIDLDQWHKFQSTSWYVSSHTRNIHTHLGASVYYCNLKNKFQYFCNEDGKLFIFFKCHVENTPLIKLLCDSYKVQLTGDSCRKLQYISAKLERNFSFRSANKRISSELNTWRKFSIMILYLFFLSCSLRI